MELFNFIKDNLILKGYEVTFYSDLLIEFPNIKFEIRKGKVFSKVMISLDELKMTVSPIQFIIHKLKYTIECIEEGRE